jgi:hypothetical protein
VEEEKSSSSSSSSEAPNESWKQRSVKQKESNLSATQNKLALFYALSHKVREQSS